MTKLERIDLERLTSVVYRLAAFAMFLAGVQYWMGLVGLGDGASARFDLLPIWWRIAAPALAFLCPVAGMGLWLLASWGPVVLVLVTIIEFVMHLGFPSLYGRADVWLAVQAGGLLAILALRVASGFARA